MPQNYNAFISYGRADSKAFAVKLYNKLTSLGLTIWFDQNDIPLGVDFQNQIDDGIAKADNFLFIIAPHSVNSPYCLKEINQALKYNKRIIPLLHIEEISYEIWQQRNPQQNPVAWESYQDQGLHSSFTNMHPEISKINWVYFRESIDDFDTGFTGLIELLNHHENYVKQHTQFLVKALEWEQNQKQTRYLLIGQERIQAETWLKLKFRDEQPPCIPTDLHCEFICESTKNSNNLTTQVFLSFAETDKKIMQQIRQQLIREGITVWTSHTDIKTAKDFQLEINQGIEGADNLVYLISPSSLNSEFCQQEISYGLSLNKRIITLLIQPTDLTTLPPEINSLQFIDLTVKSWQEGINQLIKEISQDYIYYQRHKMLLVKALKWQQQNHNPSILLRGYNLEQYQSWLELAESRTHHLPTDLQIEFITESAKQPPDLALDVFISYSRSDSDFARQLNEALQTQGKTTWFDQESIANGADFQAAIHQGIEQSDNFLFIISPESVTSPYCADEVEYARRFNKRFITILYRGVNTEELHPELAKVQWLDFNRYGGDFYANFSELIRALDTDREYVREHTKKSLKAWEWEKEGKNVDLLLRGNECMRAYEWLQEAEPQQKQPELTEWLKEYIVASQEELERLRKQEAERQAQELRKQRRWMVILSGFLALMTGLSIFSWWQTAEAKKQTEIALARQLVAESESMQVRLRNLHEGSVLLAIEAIAKFQNLNLPLATPDRILRNGLILLANSGQELPHDDDVRHVIFSPDGQYLATSSDDNAARIWDATTGEEITKFSHDGPVMRSVFSADGQYLATASIDKTARVWDITTGEEIAQFQHDEYVVFVAFSPDGRYVATAIDGNTGHVWDVTTGEEIAQLQHDDLVDSVAFSPDGNAVATASWDGTAKVWNPTTGEQISQVQHNSGIRYVTFSPDGQYLATSGDDNTAGIWNPTTGEQISQLQHESGLTYVAFSPDSQSVATASLDNTAKVWNVATGEQMVTLSHDSWIYSLAFSADGEYIATASIDKTAGVWEVATGQEITRLQHDRPLNSVAFSPDGNAVATASFDDTAKIWNTTTPKDRTTLQHDNSVFAVNFSPDGKLVATASVDDTAGIWEVATGQEITRLQHDGVVYRVAFSPNGEYIATASFDNTAKIWNTTTGQEIITLPHDDSVYGLSFSPDGKYLATASSDQIAKVWDITTGQPIIILPHDNRLEQILFSPNGKYLATVSSNNNAYIWDAVTGEKIITLTHDGWVRAIAFSPDGEYIATASDDHTARIWNTANGEPMATLQHENDVIDITFSPDSRYVATASRDNTAGVWNVATGQRIATAQHDETLTSVTFSPNSQYIATASVDNTARVWEIASGAQVAHLQHNHRVTNVNFSPDGQYLATASFDNTVGIHFWESSDLVHEACSRLRRNLTAQEWQRYMNQPVSKYQKTCDNLPVHPSVTTQKKTGSR